jgi:hypothetical protein
MNEKLKNKVFDIFYKEFKMLDKFNYIKKVFSSCKTDEQKKIVYNWGKKVLWGYFDTMTTKYQLDTKTWFYVYNRTLGLSDELKSITGH